MVDFEVCLGKLSCCGSQPLFSLSFLTDCGIFCIQNMLLFNEIHSSFSVHVTFPVPLAATQSQREAGGLTSVCSRDCIYSFSLQILTKSPVMPKLLHTIVSALME